MIAFSLDNLLFFVIIAVAALFQLLSKTISKAKKSDPNETSSSPRPQTPRPIQRAPRESDADRIRKFLEALGQPPSSTPPPPVVPRLDIPPRRLAPVQPPPIIAGVRRLPRQRAEKAEVSQTERTPIEPPGPLQQIVPPVVATPTGPAFQVELQQPPVTNPAVEAYAIPKGSAVATTAGYKTDIATLLASKSALRQAIILREIFGPPRGLQMQTDFDDSISSLSLRHTPI
jgi:hypothetical protein